jgi:hypothetical protein
MALMLMDNFISPSYLHTKFFAMKHILILLLLIVVFAQLSAQNLPPAPTPAAPNQPRHKNKKIFDIKRVAKKNRAEFGTPRHNTRHLKRARKAALRQSTRMMKREMGILRQVKPEEE